MSLGWLFWMSVMAPAMPSLAGTIEMSWNVPGEIDVSSMYWIIVIGPNQKRCRGRNGLSVGATNAMPLYFVLMSGPLMLTPVPSPQAKSGP